MEDEIRAIRLEIEGKRDEWKLAGKEQDQLLSGASEGSNSMRSVTSRPTSMDESTLNSWDEKQQTILALKSKKIREAHFENRKEFKPCRPIYAKCMRRAEHVALVGRRHAVGKSRTMRKALHSGAFFPVKDFWCSD